MSSFDARADRRSTSLVFVPLGDLDYFAAQRILDTLRSRELKSSVTLDLSALSFCDSSVALLLDWATEIGLHRDVRVVSGPAADAVLSLMSSVR